MPWNVAKLFGSRGANHFIKTAFRLMPDKLVLKISAKQSKRYRAQNLRTSASAGFSGIAVQSDRSPHHAMTKAKPT